MNAAPRICAAAFVANESDIVEAFVRHTLAFVDRIHIVFHNSYDSSRAIVERMESDGLPVTIEEEHGLGFPRERMGDAVARRLANGGHWDFVLPLDADEFIVATDRSALEAELSAAPADGALSVAWLCYVPTAADDAADCNPITRIRHRLRAPHPHFRKVFFRAAALGDSDVYLADGNHYLLSRSGRAVPEKAAAGVFLAHFPIRSAQQFVSKVRMGAVARELSDDFTENQSRHWRALAADGTLRPDMPFERLTALAADYLGAGSGGEMIEAPLATKAGPLRHADLIHVDALDRMTAFSAAVARACRIGMRSPDEDADRQNLLGELETARRVVQRLQVQLDETRDRLARARRWLLLSVTVIVATVGGLALWSWM